MPQLPTIEYGQPEPKPPRTGPLGWVLILLGIGALMVALVAPLTSTGRGRERANQVKCASNLRQIGHAIFLYAQDNAGAFPPNLQTVLATQQISAEVFTCPSSPDTPAKAPSGLAQPGHCSYVYVGAGLDLNSAFLPPLSDSSRIVALEDPADHNLEGGNILYADGHVDWQGLPIVMQAYNDLAMGKNPPSDGTTFDAASARKDYEKNWKSRMPQLKSGVWTIPTTSPSTRPTHDLPEK